MDKSYKPFLLMLKAATTKDFLIYSTLGGIFSGLLYHLLSSNVTGFRPLKTLMVGSVGGLTVGLLLNNLFPRE